MLVSGDDLEALHARAKSALQTLRKSGNKELKRADLKTELASIARDWLRLSPGLRDAGVCSTEKLDEYDRTMQDLLTSTTARARASALASKLRVFVDGAFDAVVVPLIKYQGSPRQVAARQAAAAFAKSTLTPEERTYIDESARCVTVQCYRAAIIMLWAAGIAILHAAVTKGGFDAYNAAGDATSSRKGAPFNRIKDSAKITSVPELQRSRDADLITVGMELFGYDLQIFQELDRLLGTRNDSAHPGMAHPGALDVQQYATKLASLIFDRVSI